MPNGSEKIAVQRLQYYARQDLLQKVTVANLMTEYFSKFVNSCVYSLVLCRSVHLSEVLQSHAVASHHRRDRTEDA